MSGLILCKQDGASMPFMEVTLGRWLLELSLFLEHKMVRRVLKIQMKFNIVTTNIY